MRIGVILSGCGFQDGAEIQETVVSMLALEENGAELVYFAPESEQHHVVDHLNGETQSGKRNTLVESARITRGSVSSLKSANASDLDGVFLPGGYGAALNLSTFANDGAKMNVNEDLSNLLLEMHNQDKPIGAICIAPVILARLFGDKKPRLTIGTDKESASACEAMGAEHVLCKVEHCVVDEKNKFVTSPAYMLASSVKDLHEGIRKSAEELIKLAKQ